MQDRTAGGVPMTYGTVRVTNQVVAYARKLVATGEILDVVPLALPPQTLETRARVVGDPAGGHRPRGDQGRRTSPAPPTPPSTPRSASCRSSRRATAGTSAGSRPRTTRTRARPRSSSTTATRAARASPSAGSPTPTDGSAPRSRPSASAPARTAAPRASSRRSAATATSRSTSPGRSRCFLRCSGSHGDEQGRLHRGRRPLGGHAGRAQPGRGGRPADRRGGRGARLRRPRRADGGRRERLREGGRAARSASCPPRPAPAATRTSPTVVATGMGEARNAIVVRTADAVIAVARRVRHAVRDRPRAEDGQAGGRARHVGAREGRRSPSRPSSEHRHADRGRPTRPRPQRRASPDTP